MKTAQKLSDAYMRGWAHRHKMGARIDNPFVRAQEKEYWRQGWDDCERGIIDGPVALGADYIEPNINGCNV